MKIGGKHAGVGMRSLDQAGGARGFDRARGGGPRGSAQVVGSNGEPAAHSITMPRATSATGDGVSPALGEIRESDT